MQKTKWKLDPEHSEITFKVKHMMITNVTGILSDYTVDAIADDEDFTNAEITFKGKATSITTGSDQRDKHLRSADFFDVEKNPDITFVSTSFENKNGEFLLTGDLTIKDVTKKVTLNVRFNGMMKDPWGNIKAGFEVQGKINRKDFGLTWNTALETGGFLVGEEVKIACEIQMKKVEEENIAQAS